MTAAISLPDALFETAEQAAANLGISRNTFIESALVKYLNELSPVQVAQTDEKTRRLIEPFNAVYDTEDIHLDPLFVEMQARSLASEDTW